MSDDNIERPFKLVDDDGKEACAKCAYFFNPAKADMGLCRRNPPQVVIVGSQTNLNGTTAAITQSFFAPIGLDGWCGEFSPRSVEQVVSRDQRTSLTVGADGVSLYLHSLPPPFYSGQHSAQDVVVSDGPEKPVPDPSGGGEDGSGH